MGYDNGSNSASGKSLWGFKTPRCYNEAFANCNRCVDNLQREIYEYFSGSIEFIAYSQLKKSLMIRYINPIDTAKLGDIIRKAGVKGYEIRF
ncbi:MAG: hypothetical protein ABIL48_05460 [candidate division WOR-3 bacterium]